MEVAPRYKLLRGRAQIFDGPEKGKNAIRVGLGAMGKMCNWSGWYPLDCYDY